MRRVTLCPPKIAFYYDLGLRKNTYSILTDLVYWLRNLLGSKTHLRFKRPIPIFPSCQSPQRSFLRPYRFTSTISITIRDYSSPLPILTYCYIRADPRLDAPRVSSLKPIVQVLSPDWLVSFDPECVTTGLTCVREAIVPTIPSRPHTSRSIHYYTSCWLFSPEYWVSSGASPSFLIWILPSRFGNVPSSLGILFV